MSHSTGELLDVAIELTPPCCIGYLQRPIPCDLDVKLGKIIDSFVESSGVARKKLSSAFGMEQSFGLMAYAERMAIMAVRNHSEEPLRKGLLALVLEEFKYDGRESIMRLALLNHSAFKVGINPDRIFEEIASIATGGAAQAIREFAARAIKDKSIESMGYSEDTTPDGFSYSRNW
jgi:hypothetical protein